MFIKNTLLIIAVLSGFTIFSYGQGFENRAELARLQAESLRRQEQRVIRNTMATLNRMQNRGTAYRAVYKTVFKREALSREDRKIRDESVAPETEDISLSSDFLKQPDTGIFRLFTDNDCAARGVIRADGKCKGVFPQTWFYSFREKDYSDNLFFDVLLRNGKIITDSLLSQGILVKLGNFSLDNVTLQSKGAKFLADFKPALKGADIRTQYDELNLGVESDGYNYSKEVDAEVGSVYLLRVVAYHLQRKFLEELAVDESNRENLKFFLLNQDKRSDITIAFRIVRKDATGNLTIIWKELERKGSPEAIFSGK